MKFNNEELTQMEDIFKERTGREITRKEMNGLENYILCDMWDWIRENIRGFIEQTNKKWKRGI